MPLLQRDAYTSPTVNSGSTSRSASWLDQAHPTGEDLPHHALPNEAVLVAALLKSGDFGKRSDPAFHTEMLSSRKCTILSRFAVRLENCFSQTSLRRANTLRLIDS